ncbi:MAG: peptidoglycan recognition family protein [Planctomycetota bacterium]|nr:peptidoglycan recognition family protein [Planctomycetota bacterium]
MAYFHSTSRAKRSISRRTQIVWASFVTSMCLGIGLLSIDTGSMTGGGFPLTNLADIDEVLEGRDTIFDIQAPLDRPRWTGIVVHHLGRPFGTPESIHRQHLGYGYQGLGYHFIIGNGNGLADGEIHVGYRWDDQLPGAHVVGTAGSQHNAHSIGICLVGNGDRQPFTDRQMTHLVRLIQRLQQELRIPRDAVWLHSDLAEGIQNPGRFFASGQLQEQLLDPAR